MTGRFFAAGGDRRVIAMIALLVLVILFIQKRPRGLFALRGRAVDA